MSRRSARSEFQEMIEDEDCEEMAPGSDSVHSAGSNALPGGRTTPPNSLAIMPDHIFGCGTNGESGVASNPEPSGQGQRRAHPAASAEMQEAGPSHPAPQPPPTSVGSSGYRNPAEEGGLESPSTVLGGSTSWTGGLSHGCTAVFRNNETTTATTSVPLSSPSGSLGSNGGLTTPSGVNNKLESLKSWTISTYKCSRQGILEKLGKTQRTHDTELETQIEALRDTQRKYSNILRLARALTSHFYHVVQTQTSLGETFGELANRSPELQDEFNYNAETQRNLVKNGERLIGALNFFVSSVNTLCHKTMEDTIATVKQYETARVEFDAYKSDLEFYASAPKTEINQNKQRETQEVFNRQKQVFEKLRSDVQIKLKFLDENRVKVMHKQLLLFNNAISAYFSGNQKALEATMSQFSIKLKSPNAVTPSWVEEN